MTPSQSFVARLALSLPGAAATVALPGIARLYRGPAQRFDRLLLMVFAATRLLLFILIFLVLHIEPRGDILGFYLPEARSALHGLLPYLGFPTSYAPLHPYLDGIAYTLWHSPLSLILLAILAEIAALAVWLKLSRLLADDTLCRTAGLLYLASPLSMQFVTIDGQDNTFLVLTLGLTLYLLLRKRAVASGAVFGVGIALIKFLPLIYVPQFFLTLRERWRWVAGLILALILGYGFFFLKHADLLFPLHMEGSLTTASDIPYLIGLLTGFALPNRLFDLTLLLVLAAAYLWLAAKVRTLDLHGRVWLLVYGVATLTLLLLLFSKKSWPNYFILILFNLCLLPAFRSALQRIIFAAMQILGCTSHSFWATFLQQAEAIPAHRALLAHARPDVLFLPQQLLLIAGYAWLLVLVVRQIQRLSPPAPRPLQSKNA